MIAPMCAAEADESTGDVLRRLRSGDPEAFAALFERHREPLARFVARMVDSPHVASDLVQDVFFRVWSGREQLDVRGDFRGYLRRAARNRALDWLRREDLHREWEHTAAHETAAASTEPLGAEHDRLAQLRETLAVSLHQMPERRRAVCELRWREGLGPAAIAERLGISLKTVETHITRGLKDVRADARRRRVFRQP
jgi:RNA polymerase sigma-70 factor (family 1)